MSVIASRPESASVPYPVIPQAQIIHSYADSGYAGSVQSHPSRSSSLSSFKTNYTVSTIPTSPSPTSSASYRPCDSAASLDKILESVFKRVPQEVYDNILDQLQYLHNGPNQSGCMTCFQRDLHSLSLTCRPWEKAVRARLYNRIHIYGNDSPAQLKRYRLKRGSRLKLLRRTLRERKSLANLVLELRVPQVDLLLTSGKGSAQWQEYRDLIASVVMVCPNLERLLGLTIPFNHEFDRLTHALSTRRKLKEHTWILCEATEASEDSPRSTSCPGSLGPLQMFEFLEYHASWSNLETLMLYGMHQTALEPGVFLRILDRLPSLRNLCISNFDANAFADSALLCLPPLESLRLENLPGITDAGLTQYSSRPESLILKTLVLIEPNIDSLLVISKLLASLRSLERFKIVQTNKCPTLHTDGMMVFQPLLASSSLKFLHWDVACPNPSTALTRLDFAPFIKPLRHVETPNSHLAQSILSGGFPRLDTLRAPSDMEPPGALQAVCRPIPGGQALLTPDRYSLPRSSHGSIATRPMALPAGNNLTSARIRAQTFIDMAARDAENGLPVLITDHSDSYVPDNALEVSDDELEADMEMDETGLWETPLDRPKANPAGKDHEGPVTVFDFRMPSYMGRIGAKTSEKDVSIPRFLLHPDITGQEADGGLVTWNHILTANQSLTFAAGVGVNCFGRKSVSSPAIEEQPSPATTSTPRFGWGSISGRSALGTSPTTPITPLTPMTMSPTTALPWDKDVCTGSWNYSHKSGREWWFHMERERPVNTQLYDVKRLF